MTRHHQTTSHSRQYNVATDVSQFDIFRPHLTARAIISISIYTTLAHYVIVCN